VQNARVVAGASTLDPAKRATSSPAPGPPNTLASSEKVARPGVMVRASRPAATWVEPVA
jgi:hypothetical protein